MHNAPRAPHERPTVLDRPVFLYDADCDSKTFLCSSVLVRSDGTFATGARGVFEMLSASGLKQWPLSWYRRVPAFAPLSELAYRLISSHRHFFLHVTRFIWWRRL